MAVDVPAVTATCDWYDLPCHATTFMHWLTGAFDAVPKLIVGAVLDAFGAIIAAMPALPAASALQSAIGALPSGIGYFCGAFAVGDGLAVLGGALLARFLLRRIPGIG